jgi:hypothetical protein
MANLIFDNITLTKDSPIISTYSRNLEGKKIFAYVIYETEDEIFYLLDSSNEIQFGYKPLFLSVFKIN